MIERYRRDVVHQLFTDDAKFKAYLEVELYTLEAWSELGIIPKSDVKKIQENATFSVERIYEIELETRHDIVAFTRALSESLGEEKKWVHYGLTSTDVVDTALSSIYKQANDIILEDMLAFKEVLRKQALRFQQTPCIGRTHGIHAEITSFGLKWALWYDEWNRHINRFVQARKELEVGKISGAVGNFANTPPFVQDYVCEKLGIQSANISTQTLQRDRHAHYMAEIALIGATLEKIAVEIRHLQRTEVREVEEYFHKGQKGSSAMPHKRNPISAETISGLSRVLRANAQVGLQDVPLWHERDISHSSAERIVLPDSASLAVYMTRRMARLLSNLEVDTESMQKNLNALHGVVFSQSVLLALVESGMTRDDAYRIVQSAAATAISSGTHLREVLAADAKVTLNAKQIEAAFDLSRVLRHAGRAIDSLLEK